MFLSIYHNKIFQPKKNQSFDHSVTVGKSVPGVKLGVINCQSISRKLDFVFDHINEYQLDIMALTETWLSSEDSKNKYVIDQCVAHGYTLHHCCCCCLPTPMTLASGPPASFSVHLASSAVTPAGSVHKSRGDNVVRMWVQLKR